MTNCLLCLQVSAHEDNYIDIFSKEGVRLKICEIIKKHFWFEPDKLIGKDKVCCKCWRIINDFHEYYEGISLAHKQMELDFTNIEKRETIDGAVKEMLHNRLSGSFFDTNEIKVEVNELDLLPQIEVIEDFIDSLHRESFDEGSYDALEKRIKLERKITTGSRSPPSKNVEIIEGNTRVLRKRSGRVPKSAIDELEIITEHNKTKPDSEKAKDMEQSYFSEDSESDSTDVTSSNASLPDIEPLEKYAEIPKRIVAKPKKYRKREKPLVAPVRMTQEEKDKRKAQQDEYDVIIAKFFKKFPCSMCNLLVKNFGDMRRHFRLTHNIESGYMTCCGRKFHLRKTLAEHVLVHWNPEHFKCKLCERTFPDSRALDTHENMHTNPTLVKDKKVYQCDKCPKSFTTKSSFEYHSYSKHVPKSEFKYNCTECSKKFPTERKLKDHVKYSHDSESVIICDKCGKQMRSPSYLKKHHQLEHSDKPRPTPTPMQCEICGTWLRHLSGLKQHMKTIHEEAGGEHRCHICNKISTNARALKRHIYHNHECERKFKCTMCEKAFKRPQDLREHTSTHTGEILYTCPNCPMTFFSNANMYKHRQRLHRAEWEADRKKPQPPNIMRQAVGATEAMKLRLSIGSNNLKG